MTEEAIAYYEESQLSVSARSERKLCFSRTKYATIAKGWKVTRSRLPSSLISLLESYSSDKKVAHRIAHLVLRLFYRSLVENHNDPIPISRNYVRAILNGNNNYYKFFTKVVRDKWRVFLPIKYNDGTDYNPETGQARLYILNPEWLFNKEYETIFYECRLPTPISIQRRFEGLSPIEREVFLRLKELSVNCSFSEIESNVIARKSSIIEDVMTRTTICQNGNIHYYKGNKRTIHKKGTFESAEDFYESIARMTINSQLDAIHKIAIINDTPQFPSRDTKAQRLYHPLVNVSSDYYQYIRLSNEGLYEIDLRNSQFNLLANAITLAIHDNKLYIPRLGDTLIYLALVLGRGKDSISTCTFPFQVQYKGYLCSHFLDLGYYDDINVLNVAARDGELYEVIGQKVFGKQSLSTQERDQMKLICFGLLFGHYYYGDYSEKNKFFKSKFGGFYKLVTHLKRYFKKLYNQRDSRLSELGMDYLSLNYHIRGIRHSKAGSNLLSLILSRIESNIFIDDILVELYENDIDALPKHDSIIIKESHKEVAERIIRDRLDVHLGVGHYQLRTKSLSA